MASSNADSITRIAPLRDEISKYKPGNAVTCDDGRVVFPKKLVIGMVTQPGYMYSLVPDLRRALYGDVEPSKRDDERQPPTKDEEHSLTDSISLLEKIGLYHGSYEQDVRNIAGKVGCMVLLVHPSYMKNDQHWIRKIREITGRLPLCAVRSTSRREAIEKARHGLKEHGITNIYELPPSGDILSDEGQLQWLDFLHGCITEGDRALAANDLKKICTNLRCKQFYAKTQKEAKEANQKMIKEVKDRKQEKRSLQHKIRELEQKCEESLASHESLVNDNKKLKSEMVREIENQKQLRMTLSENEKKAKHDKEMYQKRELELEEKLKSKDLHIGTMVELLHEKGRNESTLRQQIEELKNEREEDRARFEKEKRDKSWEKELDCKEQHVEELQRLFKLQLERKIRSREQAQGTSKSQDISTGGLGRRDASQAGHPREEPPDDEFAVILKRIADNICKEDDVITLGSQLGIQRGDIERALQTNMRFYTVTSDGTYDMLKQWRRGVSREEERMELRNALHASKLLKLAELC